MRLAAAHSYQRNAPVSVEDLLHVFLKLQPAIRGLELIECHIVTRQRERTIPAFRRPPSPPTAPLRGYAPVEPRYETRERVRRPAGRFFANKNYGRESGYGPQVPPEPVQAATDHLQNSRLDALEEMVRTIAGQIAGQHDEANGVSGGIFDRLQSLEAMFSSRSDVGAGNVD